MSTKTLILQNGKSKYKEKEKIEILEDFRLANVSRQASILGRKEVLTGKAKFGIFGDGKEVPQIAMAKAFKNGDFRSGYYRDQTFIFATGISTVKELDVYKRQRSSCFANQDKHPFVNTNRREMNL